MPKLRINLGQALAGLAVVAGLGWSPATPASPPAPPVAPPVPLTQTLHGDTRQDPYAWLRDRSNPEVLRYLEAENEYTRILMQPVEGLQQTLYQEAVSRIEESEASVPVKSGDYFYYERTEAGKPYAIYCRKKGSLEAPEEILLDPNQLAHQHKFLQVGDFKVSSDHRRLAYSLDTDGSEIFSIHVKDLQTGQLAKETILNAYYGLEWGGDNRTLFYLTIDAAHRPDKLHRHILGTPASEDTLLHHEKDAMFELTLQKTRDQQYLILAADSLTTSENWVLPAARPQEGFRLVQPRQPRVRYSLGHRQGKFYILTNDAGPDFRLVEAPAENPGRANWKELIPHRPGIELEEASLFQDYLVLREQEDALPRVRIHEWQSGKEHALDFPEPAFDVQLGDNRDFASTELRLEYQSLITPPTVLDYHMQTRGRVVRKQDKIRNYDPAAYTMERIHARAQDGASIPLSLVYKKGLVKNGQNPLLLYSYGAYGNNSTLDFSAARLNLLERGFVYALGHIRGGSDRGQGWYEQGKMLHKKNTFTDFIACAEHLITQKYTSPQQLAINGVSAGGLLIGAVTNMRPDLFQAVVAEAPFVDALNTMLDPTIPLTVIEYEEWGNPNEKPYFDYIKSYAPYENVKAQAYPHILVTAGLNDPRVGYWEPAKWVARLRALKTNGNLLLLHTNMHAGHFGTADRYAHLQEESRAQAFILYALDRR